MNKDELYIARILFKNKILTSDAQAFENLVVDVLQAECIDFCPVRPQGKYGDRKNDGFNPKLGKYYQVYGPNCLPSNEGTAVKKLNEDFNGLKSYWNTSGQKIKEFYYVVNDKYKGVYPSLYTAIHQLQQDNSLLNIELYRAYNIEDIFIKLDSNSIINIIGYIPNPFNISDDVDYKILTEVVSYILNFDLPYSKELIPPDPNFEAKISFNKISEAVANILRFGRQQTYVVNDFFDLNSNFAKDELRNKFEGLYNEAKVKFEGLPQMSDQIFFYIRDEASPNKKISYLNAVDVLMAHYFEYCDIYEVA
jgi:hypothetical protein